MELFLSILFALGVVAAGAASMGALMLLGWALQVLTDNGRFDSEGKWRVE